jgi:hypothetical protein
MKTLTEHARLDVATLVSAVLGLLFLSVAVILGL